jgi:sulfur relay (sulfurtransferase) DsrC/TusE family protein
MKELKAGIKVEKEHTRTFRFVKAYYRKHKKMPSDNIIARHIAQDHLREDRRYYTKLKKANL